MEVMRRLQPRERAVPRFQEFVSRLVFQRRPRRVWSPRPPLSHPASGSAVSRAYNRTSVLARRRPIHVGLGLVRHRRRQPTMLCGSSVARRDQDRHQPEAPRRPVEGDYRQRCLGCAMPVCSCAGITAKQDLHSIERRRSRAGERRLALEAISREMAPPFGAA